MRTLVAATAVVLVLSACGSSPTVGDLPGAAPSPSGSTGTGTGAGTGTDCGAVVLRQGEQLEVVGATERACLEAALREGRSATLTVTAPTVEGDPVTTSWRLDADGSLSADIDASRDRYAGSQPRTRATCGVVTSLPTPLECDSSQTG